MGKEDPPAGTLLSMTYVFLSCVVPRFGPIERIMGVQVRMEQEATD